jgi:hypothetical protein
MSRNRFALISFALAALNIIYNLKSHIIADKFGINNMELEGYAFLFLWVPIALFWGWCAAQRTKDLGLKSTSVFRLFYPWYNLYFLFVLIFGGKGFYAEERNNGKTD